MDDTVDRAAASSAAAGSVAAQPDTVVRKKPESKAPDSLAEADGKTGNEQNGSSGRSGKDSTGNSSESSDSAKDTAKSSGSSQAPGGSAPGVRRIDADGVTGTAVSYVGHQADGLARTGRDQPAIALACSRA